MLMKKMLFWIVILAVGAGVVVTSDNLRQRAVEEARVQGNKRAECIATLRLPRRRAWDVIDTLKRCEEREQPDAPKLLQVN